MMLSIKKQLETGYVVNDSVNGYIGRSPVFAVEFAKFVPGEYPSSRIQFYIPGQTPINAPKKRPRYNLWPPDAWSAYSLQYILAVKGEMILIQDCLT
jgi:hypothetical protein